MISNSSILSVSKQEGQPNQRPLTWHSCSAAELHQEVCAWCPIMWWLVYAVDLFARLALSLIIFVSTLLHSSANQFFFQCEPRAFEASNGGGSSS